MSAFQDVTTNTSSTNTRRRPKPTPTHRQQPIPSTPPFPIPHKTRTRQHHTTKANRRRHHHRHEQHHFWNGTNRTPVRKRREREKKLRRGMGASARQPCMDGWCTPFCAGAVDSADRPERPAIYREGDCWRQPAHVYGICAWAGSLLGMLRALGIGA